MSDSPSSSASGERGASASSCRRLRMRNKSSSSGTSARVRSISEAMSSERGAAVGDTSSQHPVAPVRGRFFAQQSECDCDIFLSCIRSMREIDPSVAAFALESRRTRRVSSRNTD